MAIYIDQRAETEDIEGYKFTAWLTIHNITALLLPTFVQGLNFEFFFAMVWKSVFILTLFVGIALSCGGGGRRGRTPTIPRCQPICRTECLRPDMNL